MSVSPLSRLWGESGNSEALLRPLKRPELCEGLGRGAGVGERVKRLHPPPLSPTLSPRERGQSVSSRSPDAIRGCHEKLPDCIRATSTRETPGAISAGPFQGFPDDH